MFRFFRRRAARSPRPITRVRPCLELLESRRLMDAAFTSLADRVDARLETIEQQLATVEATSATALPIMNRSVKDVTSNIDSAISTFRSTLKPKLAALDSNLSAATLRQQIYSILSSNNLLQYLNGTGTLNDVSVTKDAVTGDLSITVHVGKQATLTGVTFGVGLPGLPLNVRSGAVKVTAGFEYDKLTFGLSRGTPFVSFSGQLSATVSAGVSGTVRGSIGFMEISATPSTKKGEPTALSVAL